LWFDAAFSTQLVGESRGPVGVVEGAVDAEDLVDQVGLVELA
jgi:hypothetical protein